MKRKTFKRLKTDKADWKSVLLLKASLVARAPGPARRVPRVVPTGHRHNVYVVLLDGAVAKLRRVQRENPDRDATKPCLYVGMTGLTPEQRFKNHKAGLKAASAVKRFGRRLIPELYVHLNPMPYAAAVQMEKDLAEDLRKAGYTVIGGH